MAPTLRALTGDAFEVLRDGLRPLVLQRLKAQYRDRLWIDGVQPSLRSDVADRLKATGSDEERFDEVARDVYKLLGLILEQWHLFGSVFKPLKRDDIKRLHLIRHDWAHFEQLTVKEVGIAFRIMVDALRKASAHREADIVTRFIHRLDAVDVPEVISFTDPAAIAIAQQKLAELPINRIPELEQTLPSGSYMPFRPNPLFVSRDTYLYTMALTFKEINAVVITGMGGIGKTQLASEFVYRYGQYFAGGVFWLNFADPGTVLTKIAYCGGLGGLSLRPDFSNLRLDDQVRLVLAAWQSPLPRLLVLTTAKTPHCFNSGGRRAAHAAC